MTHIKLTSRSVPPAFDGYTMVQLSDLHLGAATPLSHLREALRTVSTLRPELLLLTGDYVQVNRLGVDDLIRDLLGDTVSRWSASRKKARELAHRLFEEISKLTLPDGIIGILGNHDYHERLADFLPSLGVGEWLLNSQRRISREKNSLLIHGIDDLWRGTPDLRKALLTENSDEESFFRLTLSHNPDVVLHDDATLLSSQDLLLCGHTHGGQIHLPLIGPIITRTEQREHTRGLSWLNNRTAVYTTNGVGYGAIKLRVLCPPEIVRISLHRDETGSEE